MPAEAQTTETAGKPAVSFLRSPFAFADLWTHLVTAANHI
jgi:hypothetical protein